MFEYYNLTVFMIMFVFTFVAVFTFISSRPDARVVENNPPGSLVEDHLDHLESHPMAHYIRNAENSNVLFKWKLMMVMFTEAV